MYVSVMPSGLVQVLTACLKSYAHGANDTANAAGPFAAVQALYMQGLDDCGKVTTPLWVLIFCGMGIVAVRTPFLSLSWPKTVTDFICPASHIKGPQSSHVLIFHILYELTFWGLMICPLLPNILRSGWLL